LNSLYLSTSYAGLGKDHCGLEAFEYAYGSLIPALYVDFQCSTPVFSLLVSSFGSNGFSFENPLGPAVYESNALPIVGN